MKNVSFAPEEKEDVILRTIRKLENLHFLYGGLINTSTDQKSLCLVYSAYTNKGEIITFGQYFLVSEEELHYIDEVTKSGFFTSGRSNEPLMRGVRFLTRYNKDYLTDFVPFPNEDENYYTFYAREAEKTETVFRFAVEKNVLEGIKIITSHIKRYIFDNDIVREANLWLNNENQYRRAASSIMVLSHKIKQISTSIHHPKLNIGVVIIELTLVDGTTTEVSMNYYSKKPVKRSKKYEIVDFDEMRKNNPSPITISELIGQSLNFEKQVITMYGWCGENLPTIYEMDHVEYNEMVKEITSIQ